MLPELNFPKYNFRIRKRVFAEGEASSAKAIHEIFDRVRKKFVALTPEEWVRQHLLEFLIMEKKFPLSLLAIEKELILNQTKKRTDLLAYSNKLKPILIAECKAPNVVLDDETLKQALRYNLVYNVSFLIITNGMNHYLFEGEANNKSWRQSESFPNYDILSAGQ